MAAEFAVFIEGLTDLDFTKGSDQKIKRAASAAINSMARKYRTRAARDIRDQINLPARLVSPRKGLVISRTANRNDLQARITASGNPTSLARFASGTPRIGKAGVTVEVQPGKARFMRRVFPLRLPQGNVLTETKFNLGLAIRLRPGERLENKTSARRVSNGLYLLYGPSVDQVFRANDGDGVANDLVPEIERDLSAEFLRLVEL